MSASGIRRSVTTVTLTVIGLPLIVWLVYLDQVRLLLLEEAILSDLDIASSLTADTRQWIPTKYTWKDFSVAGVNLATYGLQPPASVRERQQSAPPFQLYADFDLSSQIKGNETWFDLVRYRRDVQEPTLPFYVDKVARRRWLQAHQIPAPHAYANFYQSEWTQQSPHANEQEQHLLTLLPMDLDFVAKPTHLSCSGGVWLTKTVNGTLFLGNGKQKFKPVTNNDHTIDTTRQNIAKDLVKSLHTVQEKCAGKIPESWALQNVHPGVFIEDRFTGWEANDDDRAGMEFKVFTIWGKAWMVVYRPGYDHVGGFFFPNGTAMPWEMQKTGKQLDPVPDWMDWKRLIAIAERLGAHKDMFRTDIFVGIPSRKRRLLGPTATPHDFLAAVEIAVSETEVHPTPYGKETNEVFEEGSRLWLAGYRIGNYLVVPNTEVPPAFVQSGEFAL